MRKAFTKEGNDNQTYRVAHATAVRVIELANIPKVCSICGKSGKLDTHHIDGNYQNNSLSNLTYLCRSCHNKIHRKKQVCVICGKPMKGHGYCNKHYLRYKKYGDPLYHKNKVHTE